MDDSYSLWSIILFLGLVVVDALFYGFSSGIAHLNEGMLEQQNEDKKATKLLLIVKDPDQLIQEMQIVSNLVSLITGIYIFDHLQLFVTEMLQDVGIFHNQWVMMLCMLILGILLLVILISFGIVIPKKLGAIHSKEWCYTLLNFVLLFNWIFTPVILLIRVISTLFLTLLGVDLARINEHVTEEDVKTLVIESHEQGFLEAGEVEMITNIVDLDTKEAADVMTHRKNIIAVDAELTLRETVEFILNEGSKSRYPVFHKDLDDIIGILHMKDAMIYGTREEFLNKPLLEIPGLVRQVSFIPETRNIQTLFKEMQSEKIQMEIVVDEYGQTAGIITMEDILEEIVGNISDEYDQEENYISADEDGSYLVKGMAPLDEVEKCLGIEFSNDDYDTLNGFLISMLGRIPEEDEDSGIEYENYLFRIIKVQNKMIDLVKVSPIS